MSTPIDGIIGNMKDHLKKHYVGGGPFKFNMFISDDQFQDGFTRRYHAVCGLDGVSLSPSSDMQCYWISLGSTESVTAYFEDDDCAFAQVDDDNFVFLPHLQMRFAKEEGCPYGRLYWHYYVRRMTSDGFIYDAW